MSSKIYRDNIDNLLNEVAREYKKISKRNAEPIQITIIGGGSILLNHHFRSMSSDIDSIIYGGLVFKEAINNVAKKYDLPFNWINSDFEQTSSYSIKLSSVAKLYKVFCNILTVNVVDDEYLIAMKLASFRPYKHDKSDIIGILNDMYNTKKDISIGTFEKAFFKLYNKQMKKEAYDFLTIQLDNNQFIKSYEAIKENEDKIGSYLINNSLKISNKVTLDKSIREIQVALLNEEIIKEIGNRGDFKQNIVHYSNYLINEYDKQTKYKNYDAFLKNKLKNNYDIFINYIDKN